MQFNRFLYVLLRLILKTRNMRSINQYKKLFAVESVINLKDLKTTYRGLVKEWHPDKFQDEAKKQEAEIKSKEIIDGYHFLVSIAPETKTANLAAYNTLTIGVGIADFHHKKQVLTVIFRDGTEYEYFGVSPNVYQKMVNTDKLNRFAKRNIFNSYVYRLSKKATEQEAENV
jgi:curved DNA-binding protein CbpA